MIQSILLLLIGATATGAFQVIYNIVDRKREAESILTAIASEVDSICRLVRHQGYFEEAHRIAETVRAGTWTDEIFVVSIRENYFSVFEGFAPKLGMLRPVDSVKIVNFYAYCKSLIDSVRVDGPNAVRDGSPYAAANMVSVEALLVSILHLGDEIIYLPKQTIHPLATSDEAPAAADLVKLPTDDVNGTYPPHASR